VSSAAGIIQRVQIAADKTCCAYERKEVASDVCQVSRDSPSLHRSCVRVSLRFDVLSKMAKQCGVRWLISMLTVQLRPMYMDCSVGLAG